MRITGFIAHTLIIAVKNIRKKQEHLDTSVLMYCWMEEVVDNFEKQLAAWWVKHQGL